MISVPSAPYLIRVYVEGALVGTPVHTTCRTAPKQLEFTDWPVYYGRFDWSSYDSSKLLSDAPPPNVQLTDHLMKEVIERINPADRAY